MMYKIKYLPFVLLLYSCEKVEQVSESVSVINEFLIQKESVTTSDLKSTGSKDIFTSGDEIYLYGYSKSSNSPTIGTRFLPMADNTTGVTYEYEEDKNEWQRFLRNENDGLEIGFWKTGLFHDFRAYYLETKPATPNLELTLTSDGLPKEDLLWGEVKNVYFSGAEYTIPQIKFKHQLSRIRVDVMHDIDMEGVTSEDFKITEIKFNLDKKKATFNLETGEWDSEDLTGILIKEEFPSGKSIPIPKLTFEEVAEWWVLPESTLSDFMFHLSRKGEDDAEPYVVKFENLFEETEDGEPAVVKTKAGYITVLRIKLGDIKQIIFTVSLEPWEKHPEKETITDKDIVEPDT